MERAYLKPLIAHFPFRGLGAYLWMFVSTGLYSLPCLLLAPISRAWAYAIGRLYCRQILALSGAQIEIRGLENAVPGQRYTVISNHQSQFDILALMGRTPLRLHFLAKKELFDIPFFGWGIRALGHIPIDRSNSRRALYTFNQAVAKVRADQGMSLVIFPEGTRSEDGQIQPFKQGSFRLVLEAGLPVLPVTIQGSRDVLPKGRFFPRPGRIVVTLGKPIPIQDLSTDAKADLARQIREVIIRMMAE